MDAVQYAQERKYVDKLMSQAGTRASHLVGKVGLWAMVAAGVSLCATPFLGWRYLGLAGALFVIGVICSFSANAMRKENVRKDLVDDVMFARLRENRGVVIADSADVRLMLSAADAAGLNEVQRSAINTLALMCDRAEQRKTSGTRRFRPTSGPLA